MSVWAIVAAAGSGTRMQARGNKTLLQVGGVPAICRAVAALRTACEGIILVVKPQEQADFETALQACGQHADAYAPGGNTRQESIRNALRLLPAQCEVVLVHDGARPLVSHALVARVVEASRTHGSAIPALPVTDTIKQVADDGHATTLDRQRLRYVQTPQGFHAQALIAAYDSMGEGQFTDDAAVMEHAGYTIYFVEGERKNIKLTTGEDIHLAQAFLGTGTRSGIGYDVHRLVVDRPLILCGVEVPFEKGLLGHSDADAGAHAVTDALLGAAALGDIGTHFPDTDSAYQGADSLKLLSRAVALLKQHGWVPCNVDVTLVLQRPKLLPYIPHMRAKLAATCGLALDCVSVKAKTTEGLGFEGEGEGISAYATVTIVPVQ